MADLVSLKTPDVLQSESVNDCLDRARANNFRQIVIVGVDAGGGWCTSSSGFTSRLQMVGAIEFAKHDILNLE